MNWKAAILAICVTLPSPSLAQDLLLWDDLSGMTPREIGEAVLAGEDHREIVDVFVEQDGMMPPGFLYLTLYEMPEEIGNGCLRSSWKVTFVTEAPSRPEMVGMREAPRETQSVALADSGHCLFAHFTDVVGELQPDEALLGLEQLRRFTSDTQAMVCDDETESSICNSDAQTRTTISGLYAWRILREDDGTQFVMRDRWWSDWNGLWGGAVTSVFLPDDASAPVRVERRVPPPF